YPGRLLYCARALILLFRALHPCNLFFFFLIIRLPPRSTLFPYTTLFRSFMRASIKMIGVSNLQSFIASMTQKLTLSDITLQVGRSEERFSRNAETDLVCRLLLEKKQARHQ